MYLCISRYRFTPLHSIPEFHWLQTKFVNGTEIQTKTTLDVLVFCFTALPPARCSQLSQHKGQRGSKRGNGAVFSLWFGEPIPKVRHLQVLGHFFSL